MAIDLRSDTVTRPTAGMLQAMTTAPLGDDVFGDDPTVLALQDKVAQLLGKEAALFTPTGTMANQLALRVQTQPGDEVLIDDAAHVSSWESGAGAVLSGVQFRGVDVSRGGPRLEDLAARVRPNSFMAPNTSLVALENTNNHRGGEILELDRMRAIADWVHARGLRVHVDGARLWNASVASGVALRDFAACADSLSLCFSKGLGAPLGSILVADADSVQRAHRFRKMWGGGMRQAGLVAAAAVYALDHHIERLADDHRRAQVLGGAAQEAEGLELVHPVDTNIVIIGVTGNDDSAAALVADLERHDIAAIEWEDRSIRMVTHLDVTDADIETVAAVLRDIRH